MFVEAKTKKSFENFSKSFSATGGAARSALFSASFCVVFRVLHLGSRTGTPSARS
jgi:hypothetical protein